MSGEPGALAAASQETLVVSGVDHQPGGCPDQLTGRGAFEAMNFELGGTRVRKETVGDYVGIEYDRF